LIFLAEEVAGCGWAWGMGVLGISLVYFMLLDVVKVWIFRAWSFELTSKLWPSPARKNALEVRQAETKRLEATSASWHKVGKIVELHRVASAFNSQ
jgi:H+-transporting ATPase